MLDRRAKLLAARLETTSITCPMRHIAFLPRDGNPAPLPDWILSQLIDLPGNPDISHALDPVEILMNAALDASGLHEGGLLERVREVMDCDPKSLMIQKALHGRCDNDDLQKLINRILNVSDEQWQLATRQREDGIARIKSNDSQIRGHREYRKKAPFLRIFKDASLHVGFSEFVSYIHTRDLSVDMRGSEEFQPPSAEEMGAMIAKNSGVILEGFRLNYQSHGGYLYHRLPNEIHTYDYSGNLYASGATYRDTPNPPGTSC
jgi:hypothetical protein